MPDAAQNGNRPNFQKWSLGVNRPQSSWWKLKSQILSDIEICPILSLDLSMKVVPIFILQGGHIHLLCKVCNSISIPLLRSQYTHSSAISLFFFIESKWYHSSTISACHGHPALGWHQHSLGTPYSLRWNHPFQCHI
jgi:hypothetical protein